MQGPRVSIFSTCHWWVCCRTTTGTSLLYNTLEGPRYCRCWTNKPTSSSCAMSSCVRPRFATVGILRQSYPQADMVTKWNSISSNRSWKRTRFKHKYHSVRMATVGNAKTREDNPITIDSKMSFSGSERTITILTRCKVPPPKKTTKSKYTPVISNSNGNIQSSTGNMKQSFKPDVPYTCRFFTNYDCSPATLNFHQCDHQWSFFLCPPVDTFKPFPMAFPIMAGCQHLLNDPFQSIDPMLLRPLDQQLMLPR